MTNYCRLVAVVVQPYSAEAHNEHIIIGNDAIFKCLIPSFVTDVVKVDSWADNEGNAYFPGQKYGKKDGELVTYFGEGFICANFKDNSSSSLTLTTTM